MGILTTSFKPVLAALAGCALVFPAAQSAAQVVQGPLISNVAQAEWDIGGQRFVIPSNRVDIQVQTPAPPPPPTISTYHFSSPTGAEQLPIPSAICRGTGGNVPFALQGIFSGTATNPGTITPTESIRAGEPLIVSILAATQNADPTQIDRFDIVLTTPSGDRERIEVVETNANSGRFIGAINTAAIPPNPVQADCTLSVRPGDQLIVEIDDITGTALGSVELTILVDPFGLTFDSGDAAPVSGSRVTLIDDATGQPAEVFGDDAISSFPSTVVTGTTVTDSGGTSYSFAPGFYRFPFARPGRYRLLIEPPAPYTAPSGVSPAELATLRRPDGQPFTIADGSYGGIIVLDNPAPVRIDVPLDRPGGVLQITKSASRAIAVPGDAVQYRVVVQNRPGAL
ncbi:MAG: hypothetical protein U5J78_01080 [Parasphingorhabdus sp.]|nr:hypothetical protein [Parasphingorhabdus sp.]